MMAHQVCEDDPRTLGQRRADALGALAAGSTVLACQCGGPACPAATVDARAGAVVIHVLPDQPAPDQPIEDHLDRALAMPRRRRTRAADRAFRIRCQRALNDGRVAERGRPPPF